MNKGPLRVGLIGLGAVGQSVIRLVDQHAAGELIVVAALVRDRLKARDKTAADLVTTVDGMLAMLPEVVIEAGGHDALRAHGSQILRAHCELIMISVGALADPALEREIISAAREGGVRARVVSGAIGGLDALSAAALGGLTAVTHTTRKPARALLSEADAMNLSESKDIFLGTAREAALLFPESVNVAAAVSLAGIGFDRTLVRVVADPAINLNQHEVYAEGAFGRLRFHIGNIPSDANARTARLVAMSAVSALLQRRSSIVVG